MKVYPLGYQMGQSMNIGGRGEWPHVAVGVVGMGGIPRRGRDAERGWRCRSAQARRPKCGECLTRRSAAWSGVKVGEGLLSGAPVKGVISRIAGRPAAKAQLAARRYPRPSKVKQLFQVDSMRRRTSAPVARESNQAVGNTIYQDAGPPLKYRRVTTVAMNVGFNTGTWQVVDQPVWYRGRCQRHLSIRRALRHQASSRSAENRRRSDTRR